MKPGQYCAVVCERIGARLPEHLTNHVVKVQDLPGTLFLTPHSFNSVDYLTGSPAIRDDILKDFAQFLAAEAIAFQETQASPSVGHNCAERLTQLVRERPGHFTHDRDAAQMRELCAVLQCFRFGLPAGGDVHDDAQNQRAFRALNGADPDLDGKLGPVLSPGEQLPAGSHGPRRRRGMKVRSMSRVLAAEPLGHEEFNVLPDELFAFITKQFLDARVHQYDVTLRIDQDDAVGRSFHDEPEPFLRLLALSEVNARTDVPEERAIGGKARRSNIQNPAIFTVASSQAVFHRERLPGVKGVNIDFKTAVEVFTVNALCPPIAKLLLQWAAVKVEATSLA